MFCPAGSAISTKDLYCYSDLWVLGHLPDQGHSCVVTHLLTVQSVLMLLKFTHFTVIEATVLLGTLKPETSKVNNCPALYVIRVLLQRSTESSLDGVSSVFFCPQFGEPWQKGLNTFTFWSCSLKQNSKKHTVTSYLFWVTERRLVSQHNATREEDWKLSEVTV